MASFFEMLYEGFPPLNLFYINGFSNDMFSADAYTSIGLMMLFSALIMEGLYYFVLSNYGKMHRRSFWFLWLFIIAVLNFVLAYINSMSSLTKVGTGSDYTFSQYFSFSMVNVLWAVVFSFIFSVIFKFWSVSASRTPF
ncbi:hypothetical protein AM493_01170 [Flavobacterium akiainvivens]|uniref:Uncharacterized protein n=1 Tax=Flavobacterium akiainvivens TaxID=1202724 RepID=A0A0M8MFP3_9FLAO|nr:hypothetical protein [Flavobacterium akiainvivens]KOS04807.1 hypothetical protein AM493_01170 [Flavobacterium akiainvivens]SFQ43890.1 hypothetical protein SAMN05444144_104293 [Flavobacterium akiainvivens]